MSRIRAAAGLIGPIAFTAAWIVGGRRQEAYRISHEHISGLAAVDAQARHVMTAGFLTLGTSTLAFASELDRRLGGGRRSGWGPTLIGASGLCTLVAGSFPRDRRSNTRSDPDETGQSWINDVHDTAAVAGGVAGVAGLAALARRMARDPEWRSMASPALATAAVGGGLTAWFLRDVVRPGNGIVQRVSVSVPLAFMGALAVKMLRRN